MSREKIRSKYGMSARQPDMIVTNRKLSPSVLKLRAFILENRHHGIQLVINDGRPALHFNPGLKKGNKERWEAALRAEVLLYEAAADLKKLISQNNLDLSDQVPGPAERERQEQLL